MRLDPQDSSRNLTLESDFALECSSGVELRYTPNAALAEKAHVQSLEQYKALHYESITDPETSVPRDDSKRLHMLPTFTLVSSSRSLPCIVTIYHYDRGDRNYCDVFEEALKFDIENTLRSLYVVNIAHTKITKHAR